MEKCKKFENREIRKGRIKTGKRNGIFNRRGSAADGIEWQKAASRDE